MWFFLPGQWTNGVFNLVIVEFVMKYEKFQVFKFLNILFSFYWGFSFFYTLAIRKKVFKLARSFDAFSSFGSVNQTLMLHARKVVNLSQIAFPRQLCRHINGVVKAQCFTICQTILMHSKIAQHFIN